MATQITCDYCGEPIADPHLMVRLRSNGHEYSSTPWGWELVLQDVGHYHASEDQQCWAEMFDRLALVHAVSSDLGPDREAVERRIERRRQRDRNAELREQQNRRAHAWRRLPQERRDELLLQALGEQRLTIPELTSQLNAGLDAPTDGWPTLYSSTVASMVRRLVAVGEFDRIGEPFQGKIRYRYFVKRFGEAVA